MRRVRMFLLSGLVLAAFGGVHSVAQADPTPPPHVLVFSGTYGFRHSSIGTSLTVLRQLAQSSGAFTVETTEDPTVFTAAKLRQTDILLFANTTGETPLTDAQRVMIESWWSCGGGFAGIHAATDTNYTWPAYQEMIGAAFKSHPHTGGQFRGATQPAGLGDTLDQASVLVEDATSPITAAWAGQPLFRLAEEFYKYRTDPRLNPNVHPLLALDETTVYPWVQTGPAASDPYYHQQPVEWTSSFRNNNRVWYTNLGHYDETYARADWKAHTVAALRWVAGIRPSPACLTAAGIG